MAASSEEGYRRFEVENRCSDDSGLLLEHRALDGKARAGGDGIATTDYGADVHVEFYPINVCRRVTLLDSPPPSVVLDLGNQSGLGAFTHEVVVEPLEQVVGPVPPQCVGERLCAPTAVQALVIAAAVWVMVAPLTIQALDLEPGLDHRVMDREGHVWVDVPVLHPMDDVDGATVILNGSGEEVPLLPVIASCPSEVVTCQVSPNACIISLEVTLTRVLGVLEVAIEPEAAVDAVVHDGAPSLHTAVSPHQVMDPNQSGHRHDCPKILRTHCRSLPWRRAVV